MIVPKNKIYSLLLLALLLLNGAHLHCVSANAVRKNASQNPDTLAGQSTIETVAAAIAYGLLMAGLQTAIQDAAVNRSPIGHLQPLQKSYIPTKIEGDIVNRGRYRIAAEKVITELDIQNMRQKLRLQGRKRNLEAAATDALIERALVELDAQKNVIIVSEQRLQNEVSHRSLQQGLSEERFKKKIERETRLPFTDWLEELRYQLIRQQLLRISLHVPRPTPAEIQRFYRKNRSKMGLAFRYREIVLTPQNNSLKEEARISAIGKVLERQVRMKPSAFARLAQQSPHNSSPYRKNGGLRPYQSIYDIASKNPILASLLFSHRKKRVSPLFRDSFNRYMLIKVESYRPLALSQVRHMILQHLYIEKEKDAFKKWVASKRQETLIEKL